MDTDEKSIYLTEEKISNDDSLSLQDQALPISLDDNLQQDESVSELEDDIIRNDTIPETPTENPGSIGAFAVGAFDTSKD